MAFKVLDRGKRRGSPCEIPARGVYEVFTEKIISRGEGSGLPPWSKHSVETTHHNRGKHSTGCPQSHGGKSVVQGLPPKNVGKGQEFALCS